MVKSALRPECAHVPRHPHWSRVFLCFWFSQRGSVEGRALGLSSCVSALLLLAQQPVIPSGACSVHCATVPHLTVLILTDTGLVLFQG